MDHDRFQWSTPPAPAAIAVLVLAARQALIDRPLPAPGRARFARLIDPRGVAVDEVVATRLDERTLELAVHGGPGMRAAVERCLAAHGLEAADVEDAVGTGTGDGLEFADRRWREFAAAAHPAAVDRLLAGDDARLCPAARGLLFRVPVVLITGPPNAGKSSLLNAWCGQARALVSDLPGTTRDLVAAETLVAGWRLRLIDSAGLRETSDPLERAGQALVDAARGWADVVIHLAPPDGAGRPCPGDIVVLGKADQRAAPPDALAWSIHGVAGRDALNEIGAEVLRRLGLGAGRNPGETPHRHVLPPGVLA